MVVVSLQNIPRPIGWGETREKKYHYSNSCDKYIQTSYMYIQCIQVVASHIPVNDYSLRHRIAMYIKICLLLTSKCQVLCPMTE